MITCWYFSPVLNVIDNRRLDPALRQALLQQFPAIATLHRAPPTTPTVSSPSTAALPTPVITITDTGTAAPTTPNMANSTTSVPVAVESVIDWSAIASSTGGGGVKGGSSGVNSSAAGGAEPKSVTPSPEKHKKRKQMRRSKNHRNQLKAASEGGGGGEGQEGDGDSDVFVLSSSHHSDEAGASETTYTSLGQELAGLRRRLASDQGKEDKEEVKTQIHRLLREAAEAGHRRRREGKSGGGETESVMVVEPVTSQAFYRPLFEALMTAIVDEEEEVGEDEEL